MVLSYKKQRVDVFFIGLLKGKIRKKNVFNYQFNYFFRNPFAEAKPEKVGELMMAFENKFLPMFLDEHTPAGVNKILRMVGMDIYSNVSVMFGSEVVSIHINSKDREEVTKDKIFNHLSFVFTCLKKINKSKMSYRISSVFTSLDNSSEEYNALLRSKFLSPNIPADIFEWNVRVAKKDKVRSENINCITTVNRASIMSPELNSGRVTDALVIEIDVNTVAENGDARFSFDSIEIISSMFDFARDNYKESISGE
jgi:hypothetical protein